MTTDMKRLSWYEKLERIVANGIFPQVVHRVLLCGPHGTGKSSAAAKLFGANRVERVVMHRQLPPEDLIGTRELVSDGSGGTSTSWADGPAIRAMREGKALVVDEIDEFSPEVRGYLHAILDDTEIARVSLPDGSAVTPSLGYCVFATSNSAPSALPDPLLDRFDLILYASRPPQGALDALRDNGVRAIVSNEYDSAAQNLNWTAPITFRRAYALDKLARKMPVEDAAHLVFGERGSEIASAVLTARM